MKSVGGEGFLSLPAFGKFIHDYDIFLWLHFICPKPNTFLFWTTCHRSFNHAKTAGCLKIGINYCKKMNKLQLLHLATACAQKTMHNSGSVSSLVSSFQNTKGVLLIAVGVGNSQKCESTDLLLCHILWEGERLAKTEGIQRITVPFTLWSFSPYLFMLSIIVSRKVDEMDLNNI